MRLLHLLVVLSGSVCCLMSDLSSVLAQGSFRHEAHFDTLVDPYLKHEKFVGISVGVIVGDQRWTKAYGRLTPDGLETPDSRTIYEIGSISKVLTSLLLADAVRQGSVGLDDSIGKVWKELAEKNPKVAESIRFRHLSLHMSGLPVVPSNMAAEDPTNPFAGYGREQLTQYMFNVQLTREPGDSYEYSNLGVGLLGDLLCRQSGKNYEQLLRDRLTVPLKMNDLVVSLSDEQRTRLAPPYNLALLPDKSWDFDALAGCGAIRSSVDDMLILAEATLHPPQGPLGEAINLAWDEHKPAMNGLPAMGLGWMIAQDGSTRWHNGQTGGYESMMLVSRTSDCAVVVLCNTADARTDQLAIQMIQTLMGLDVKPTSFDDEFQPDPTKVSRLAGRYVLAPTAVLTVQVHKNRMMAQITGQQFLALTPISDTEWKYKSVDAKLQFELPETGDCPQVRLLQNGRSLPARRLP